MMKKMISVVLTTGLLMSTVAFSAMAYDGKRAPNPKHFKQPKIAQKAKRNVKKPAPPRAKVQKIQHRDRQPVPARP